MRRGAIALLAAAAVAGCGGSDEETPPPRVSPVVSGPLCDALPHGDDPGAPATIAGEPPAVVLTWIPVITSFEAAVRAAGLEDELDGTTILAPSDDAFAKRFSERRLDALLLERHDDLRALLERHLVEGELSLADLRDAGEVTTLAGDTLAVAPAGAMARLGDRAETVCADYAAATARVHVIDAVL